MNIIQFEKSPGNERSRWIATDNNGTIIAELEFSHNSNHQCLHIYRLYVDPARRRQGIGTQLIMALRQAHPNSWAGGDILYPGPIPFWAIFDESLRNLPPDKYCPDLTFEFRL